ncbi:hypothetical protein BG004_007185 [Podila humilis]|nr:hypothetical protein BG004_007185 [Podila humilis]
MDDDDGFPFSFGNASDDDGSDGLFCAPKVVAQPAAVISTKWFQKSTKSVQKTMLQEKTGATKIKMTADYLYMLARYEEAYDLAQEYCQVIAMNEVNMADRGNGGIARPDEGLTAPSSSSSSSGDILKVTDSKEMQEMAIRCAIKLNRWSEVEELANSLSTLEPGSAFLKAKVYSEIGRWNGK